MEELRFNTRAIHAGQSPEEVSGAVMPPIFQTSTYAQHAPGDHRGHVYARISNPTRSALERLIAGLEGGREACCFASGVAAMDAIMKTLRPGDHVIACEDLYGGTYRLFTKVFEPFGIRFSFVDMTDPVRVEAAIGDSTRLIWMESPTNPLLRLIDIRRVSDIARSRGILTVVDNSFASPYLQRPLELGATAVMHSTTKYLGGHSDAIGGVVVSSDEGFMEAVRFQVKTSGAVPGPMDCYLILRGIKTLHVRVQRSVENAVRIARMLRDHPEVGRVIYPGLPDHPQHDLACRQMDGPGAMISFELAKGGEAEARAFASRTRLFTLAESLGGVESLINHPASMTHSSIPREVRMSFGLSDSLLRLSVGIEDAEDLMDDLQRSFASFESFAS